jgi:hypothetical protein
MRQNQRQFIVIFLALAVLLEAETFKNVEYLYKPEGKDKGQQVEGKLNFNIPAKKITFESKRIPTAFGSHDPISLELAVDAITDVVYERTSKPRYAAGLLLAWPLLFTKEKKHFLTVQYKDGEGIGRYAIFHLDKGNVLEILAATEAFTGKKVERSEER